MTDTRGRAAALRLARLATWAVLALGAAGLIVDEIHDGRMWFAPDNGLVLYEGVEMSRGARLYVDWYDTNPPSIYLLTSAVARLAAATGAPVTLSFYLLVVALGALGARLLDRFLAERDPHAAAAALLSYAFFVFQAGYQVLDFGQREHLFSLLYVPFVFAAGSGARPGRRHVPWLLLLGFLAMMKPHFLVGVGVVGLVAWLYGRSLGRLATIALALGALAPLPLLYLHAAESFSALFVEVLPMHLGGVYSYYQVGFEELLRPRPVLLTALTAAAAAAALRCRRSGAAPRVATDTWLAAVATMWLGVFQQQKFWDYQFAPVGGLVFVGGAYFVVAALSRVAAPAGRRLRTAAVCVVGLLAVASPVRLTARTAFSPRTPLTERILGIVERGAVVMPVSARVPGLFDPDAETVRIPGPWTAHFELPAAAAITDPELRDRTLAAYADALRIRIRETRPELVLFSTDQSLLRPGIDPHELFVHRYPVLDEGLYLPVPAGELAAIDLRDWSVFRRRSE